MLLIIFIAAFIATSIIPIPVMQLFCFTDTLTKSRYWLSVSFCFITVFPLFQTLDLWNYRQCFGSALTFCGSGSETLTTGIQCFFISYFLISFFAPSSSLIWNMICRVFSLCRKMGHFFSRCHACLRELIGGKVILMKSIRFIRWSVWRSRMFYTGTGTVKRD
jgi:hypothetical protein